MSQCNLFAFHTMFNLLFSGNRGVGIRGPITGCGLLLHCMNKVGVYCAWALGSVANPRSAQFSWCCGCRWCQYGFYPGLFVGEERAPSLEHLKCSLGKRGGGGRQSWWKTEGTSKRFQNRQMPSLEVTGLLYRDEKQCLSSGLRQDQRHWYQCQQFGFIKGRTEAPAFAVSLLMWAAQNTRSIEDEAWRV